MEDQRTQLPPIWKKPLQKAIHLRVYRNGDENFPGAVVTLNRSRQKTFESWLKDLSTYMKLRSGAVWRVFTPINGHRVDDLESLEDGKCIVVAGQEKFKPLRYAQIDPAPKKGGPRNYDVEPGHNRRYQVSARIHKIDATSKIIRCWKNGDDTNKPNVVSLPTRYCHTVEDVLDLVSQVMQKNYVFGPVSKLYLPSGERVSTIDQIFANTYFVALRRSDHFKKVSYKEVALSNFSFSPRWERRSQLPPLPRSNKTSSQSSPEHSTSSNNGYRRERERVRKEEDQVFPARPIKHKRSSEKVRQVDYDEDSGGVFKARNPNRATKGARPIDDSKQTRTDLPVDQRPAEEVQDEEDHINSRDHWDGRDNEEEKVKGTLAKDNKKKKEESQERTYRTNARRQQADEEDPERRQAQQEAEREARAKREAEDRERVERSQRQQEERKRKEEEKRRQEEKQQEEDLHRRKMQAVKQGPHNDEVEDSKQSVDDQDSPPAASPTHGDESAKTDLDRLEEERREKENLAATKIQAGYRGYRTRKQLKEKQAKELAELERDPSLMEDDPLPVSEDDQTNDQQTHAATTIQSGFRGYKARQEVQRMKEEEISRKEG
ncbi:doublecortin domain-containing protein 2-like isoform X3 [Pomacea canaliculata]|uniref:doublecortin domain-containing protein 2-like isoform X3 n=1 Tax=Pomacea canaliculata TaxID=400727 RepID=UPI000D725D5D|nr:doublecortin domain-containing protein 2-like isoform X3 [Pomacea canaliculata]